MGCTQPKDIVVLACTSLGGSIRVTRSGGDAAEARRGRTSNWKTIVASESMLGARRDCKREAREGAAGRSY